MAKKSKMMRVDANVAGDSGKGIAKYVRVSTDKQREEGYSVEIQKEKLEAYASAVLGERRQSEFYIDDGFSGGSLNRPEMRRLISDVTEGRVDTVVVYKLDRLSRSQKDTLHLIEDIFIPNNVTFISMQESFNTSTAFGRAVVGILSVFAQLERENIFERTRSGMKKRVESGLWMGGGKVPYGYDYDAENGILVQNGDAENVKRIYGMYLAGASLQSIADKLGLKYEKLASQILARKSNAGIITYNGQEYAGRHEPIISMETYELAMAAYRERSARKCFATTSHMLTGIVYCGICGAKMRYIKWGKYYRLCCYSQQSGKKYLVKDPNCDNARPIAEDIERIVTSDLFAMTKSTLSPIDDETTTFDTLAIMERQRENLKTKLRRFYNLYTEEEDDIIVTLIGETKQELKSIDERIKLEEERGVLAKIINQTKETIKNIEDVWDAMSGEERQSVIRSVVERITVTHDKVDISYKF